MQDRAYQKPSTELGRKVSLTEPRRWVDLHGDALYSFAFLRTGNTRLAEDLVQETFLAALKSRAGFQGQSSERTWLIGILKHKLIDHLRKTQREQTFQNTEDETRRVFDQKGAWLIPPKNWPETPERIIENREFWKVLAHCMDLLPPRLRQVFSLRDVDGMHSDEICKILGLTPTNLWVALHRARARLRSCLETTWFDEVSRGQG